MAEKDLQAKLQHWQLLQARADAIRRQQEIIHAQLAELEQTATTIEGLQKIKPGEEIMLPIGAGSFASGKITNTNNFLIDVGSEIFIQKSADRAKEILVKRKEKMSKVLESMEREMVAIANEIKMLASEIEKLSAKK